MSYRHKPTLPNSRRPTFVKAGGELFDRWLFVDIRQAIPRQIRQDGECGVGRLRTVWLFSHLDGKYDASSPDAVAATVRASVPMLGQLA